MSKKLGLCLCGSGEKLKEKCIYVTDWIKVEPYCDKCGKTCCSDCLLVCFSCKNKPYKENYVNTSLAICSECNNASKTLTKIHCEYHTWYQCNLHKNPDKCRTCKHNENYDLKHQ